jgi:hypothetical protein
MKKRALSIGFLAVLLSLTVWQVLARIGDRVVASAVLTQQDLAAPSQGQPQVQAQQGQANSGVSALPKSPYLEKLSDKVKVRLKQDGFAIVGPQRYSTVPSLYSQCKQENIPVFVTTDAILHTSHQLFDWCLRFLEMGHLRDDTINLTDAMLREMMTRYDESKGKLPREAALLAASYFTVAKRLIAGGDTSDIPAPYGSIIKQEIALATQANGFQTSPLMGYTEDYSQYKPRGHYSRTKLFEQYFRCMMWYGRMNFRISRAARSQPGASLSDRDIQRQALAAAMICDALNKTKVKGETAGAVWKRIYETTAFFAGLSDDLTLADCEQALNASYGTSPTPAAFADEKKLSSFMAQVQKLRKPRILSTLAVSGAEPSWEQQTHAISFMGQRFTADALIFKQLIFDRVGKWEGGAKTPFTAVNARGMWIRGLPRGLDVMAALGSEPALGILQQDGDTAYEGYSARLEEARKGLGELVRGNAGSDLYQWRMAAVKALTEPAPQGSPQFCQGVAWSHKQLQAALGSWTELKHDTLLYTRQTYSHTQSAMAGVGKGGMAPPQPKLIHGYVEPAPEVYAALAQAVEMLRGKMTTLNYPQDRALENNLTSYAGLLRQLESIARKELAGQSPSEAEYEMLWNIGGRLSMFLGFPHNTDVGERFMTEMDKEMPIVADVATDPNSRNVLEQAVGWPMVIYAVAPVDRKPTVCKGITYSYYEFKQPMAARLTDEEWRRQLTEGRQPDPPWWVKQLMAESAESR